MCDRETTASEWNLAPALNAGGLPFHEWVEECSYGRTQSMLGAHRLERQRGGSPRTEPVRQGSQQVCGNGKKVEEVGRVINAETGANKGLGKRRYRVPAEMTGGIVFVRPKPRERGNGDVQPPIRTKITVNFAQKVIFRFDMFEHVEQTNGVEPIRTDCITKGSFNNLSYSAPKGVLCSRVPRLDKDDADSGSLNGACDVTVSSSNIEDRPTRRKCLKHGQNTVIAMSEPKGFIFDGKTKIVAILRIGNRRHGYPSYRLGTGSQGNGRMTA